MGHSGKSENLDLSVTPLDLLCGKPDLLLWPDHLFRIWENNYRATAYKVIFLGLCIFITEG